MLTNEQEAEIKQIIFSLEEYGLGDIKKSLKQNMLIATFILCTCFIEAMVQYFYYKQSSWIKGDPEKNWGLFVDNFFPSEYHGKGKELYLNLRNKSVHNYSGNRFYSLGDYSEEGKATHLQVLSNGKIYLNVHFFVTAVDFAFYKFKNELQSNESQKLLALQRFADTPIFKEEKL